MIKTLALFFILMISFGFISQESRNIEEGELSGDSLKVIQDENTETISVYRTGGDEPIVVQNAKSGFRPYLHPIVAPDGDGTLTEYSPGHHTHQTGLYWGFTQVNGRDYFHNPEEDYWRRISAEVVKASGDTVMWRTVYNLLDENGSAVLRETQNWSMTEKAGKFVLDLEWKGKARKQVTIGEYDYGGLFLRMPWHEGIEGEVVNAARQRDERAEGQRAMWIDVGMRVEGRENIAHIAIFDHPDNEGFPHPWRVDGQMGVGPARARLGDWEIEKGETEVIRHQLVVYTGDFNDVELASMWEDYSDLQSKYATAALWKIAQEEALEEEFLTPEEAAEAMTVKDGFNVNVWAAEPMMKQPMAFTWDNQGRLWVAENMDYETRHSGFSGSGDSRIIILEDTDKDGAADKRKVFLEGIAFPSAIAVGFDGLFIGAPPNLLFVPDRNNDDKPDVDLEDIEVRLTGWGIRDRHETLNSMTWGPDGWLYGLQGFATPSTVRKPEGDGRIFQHNDPFPDHILKGEGTKINGGVWRYHPVKEEFEVVAHGFSNPWGIDYDSKGQLLMSACVIPHLWHVIPGGIYHRQGGQHFNPYVYDDIKTIADHRHRSAHGGARVYLSDAFPEEQQGRIFMANIHEHAVLSDKLTNKGSGFTSSHGEDFLMANNAQWVGFSMELGPGGNLYTLDWHDADICGTEVHNNDTGRIFRVSPKHSQAQNWEGRYSDLSKMSDKKLIDMQTKVSSWHARRARLILQNRTVKGELNDNTHSQLREIFHNHSNPDWRLRAMWGLHVTGGFDHNSLLQALEDRDEYIRSWAIQLLGEDKAPPPQAIKKFVQMARDDSSPVVRLYLASVLERLDYEFRWDIIEELVQHQEDADDHNIPKMIWYGFEPLVGEDPDRAMELVAKSKIPLVTKFAARRVVDAESTQILVATIGHNKSNKEVQLNLLKGMQDGLEGQYDQAAPSNWKQVYGQLQQQSNEEVKSISRDLAQQYGDAEAVKEFVDLLRDKNAPVERRRDALEALAAQENKELVGLLPRLLDDQSLRIDAIHAIAEFELEQLRERLEGEQSWKEFMLFKRYDSFNKAEKTAAIQTMASRPGYGELLMDALREDIIPKSDIPTYTARQLMRVIGSGFMEVWGQPLEQDEERIERQFIKYEQLLTDKALSNADAGNGRIVFDNVCGQCHQMFGEGGEIGPDLTGSNRTSKDYLLFHTLRPDAVVQDIYKMVVVNMRDGRTYTGILMSENERQITMRIVGRDPVILNKSEIQSREITEVSMMPPGLFNNLTDKEVTDLIQYFITAEE